MSGELTQYLEGITPGTRADYNKLLPLVYEEMRRMAHVRLGRERQPRSITATDLVDETVLKLVRNERIHWRDRGHFFSAVAEEMRRILVDHARKRNAEKRGGGRPPVPISVADIGVNMDLTDVMALEEALEKLKTQDTRAYKVVMLRFFTGLGVEETAESLGISERTIKREWAYARSWLINELE